MFGLLLYLANGAGVVAGFFAFKFVGSNQLSVQIPVAVVVSVALYALLCFGLKALSPKTFSCQPMNLLWIFAAALIWNPVIFIPLHYITQGYLTQPVNILAMTLFQIPTNSLTWLMACGLFKLNVAEDEL